MSKLVQGLQLNGLWAKILAVVASAGLIAAFGAAVRLEVLASEFRSHDALPLHTSAMPLMDELRAFAVRQEAVNFQVQENALRIQRMERKLDALLLRQGVDIRRLERDLE
jgi:hypothetical protein